MDRYSPRGRTTQPARRRVKAWLMVEDDPGLRSMLSAMIALWGRDPLVFEDGYRAMGWLDDLDGGIRTPVPELALLDIAMPGPNGLAIAERLRATEETRHIPIMILTAMTLIDEQLDRIERLGGPVRVMYKPVPSLRSLREVFEEMLGVKMLTPPTHLRDYPDSPSASAPRA